MQENEWLVRLASEVYTCELYLSKDFLRVDNPNLTQSKLNFDLPPQLYSPYSLPHISNCQLLLIIQAKKKKVIFDYSPPLPHI